MTTNCNIDALPDGRATAPSPVSFTLRKATLDDRRAIEQLIQLSARGLSRAEYSDEQIEGAIRTVFGVDTNLIEDGTYFVVESDGELIGCGGWSKRRTLFGGDQYSTRDASELDPKSEPAKIRAFFVHPQHARKGVARAILDACESEAKAAGFQALELMATLPGIKFYKASGYQAEELVELSVGDGIAIGLLPMRKELS
jgi:GNAT superfamily N-acetyltransferase